MNSKMFATRAPRYVAISCRRVDPLSTYDYNGFGKYQCQSIRSQSTVSSSTQSTSTNSNTLNSSSLTKGTTHQLPPHSLLPTKMLFRSFLVSTIMSTPLLLSPALNMLTFLINSKSSIFNVDRNPILHFGLKKSFYEHFCAGETGEEVMSTIKNMKKTGFKGVILTYAKEVVIDAKDQSKDSDTAEKAEDGNIASGSIEDSGITSWRDGVLKTVKLLGDDDFLALKFTGAGASVMKALASDTPVPPQMIKALEEICQEAIKRSVRILVDAEQVSVQGGIDKLALKLMQKYNQQGSATVYNTYQAYLKSTPSNLISHMEYANEENFTIGVKLVRGAYINSEPRQLINDTKEDTDDSYNSIARGILTQSYAQFQNGGEGKSRFPSTNLFLATHNKDSTITGYQLHHERLEAGEPTVKIKYGQLLGMADEVSCSLLQLGQVSKGQDKPEVYKCLSWGSLGDCLSYLLRRAVENRDAVERTKMERSAIWTELKRRTRASLSFGSSKA